METGFHPGSQNHPDLAQELEGRPGSATTGPVPPKLNTIGLYQT